MSVKAKWNSLLDDLRIYTYIVSDTLFLPGTLPKGMAMAEKHPHSPSLLV